MILQLSSGIGGPMECAMAVGGVFEALKKEHPDIRMIASRPAKAEGCYHSIMFETDSDLSGLVGTILWTCKSPLRPHHKRKNWYIDCSEIRAAEKVDETIAAGDLKTETFRSSGPGGQNVNKVSTGVRMAHVPTGITVTSTEERSQSANRRSAERKIAAILAAQNAAREDGQRNSAWQEHSGLVRGNPVRTYSGPDFKLNPSSSAS